MTLHLSTCADSSTDSKKVLKQTETNRDGQKQTEINKIGQKQTETDSNGPIQTETDRGGKGEDLA